jgi:hypothetical protein
MIFTYENLFLLFFLIVLIIGIYVVTKLRQEPLKRFELVIMYLGGLATLLVSINIYLNLLSANRIEKNYLAYNLVKDVQKNYLGPQREMVKLYPESFFLYTSVNPDVDFSDISPKNYDPTKRELVELYGTIRFFQAMEDFLSTVHFENEEFIYSWLNVFLLWMQSPILRKYWLLMAPSFAARTRRLIDTLIKNSDILIALRKKKGFLTRDDYGALSKPLAPTIKRSRAE